MTAWHEIGAIGLCKEGEMREFKVSNEAVVLWCYQGEYHAFQGLCPHMK
ncbi:MAG: Rieske 2Fe-2S domain-containing protein, partial [Anaerolineae bacterium]